MNWYAAHLILYVKFKEPSQAYFPLWENIVLIQADMEDEAWTKAEQLGRDEEGDEDGTFRWDDKPATWVFAGVRQLLLCVDPEERPGDGTEVTYSEMEVDSLAALEQFVSGQPATVRFTAPVQVAQ